MALRGRAVTFRGDPFQASSRECLLYEEDALVVIADGRIAAFGSYGDLRGTIPDTVAVTHYGQAIISAGFVDAHVHYPQLQMAGACGEQLLEWLQRFVFPAELAFADHAHAERGAHRFLREPLRAGTTGAAVYCTVHEHSMDAFFAEFERFNTPARHHAARLRREHDALFLQTHVSEKLAEPDRVRRLFLKRRDPVYAHAGLLGLRAILGHGVHLGERERQVCHQTGTALAHCPTSNLFLGSGLFRLFEALDPRRPVRVGLGTDIGAGTSRSQLATLNEAYKVAQLTGHRLDAVQAFYLATLGGAAALRLDDGIGRSATASRRCCSC